MKNTDFYGNCPNCNVSWDDGSILDKYKQKRKEGDKFFDKTDDALKKMVKEYYSPPYRFSKLIGVELQEEYDGVLYWECPNCKTKFNSFL